MPGLPLLTRFSQDRYTFEDGTFVPLPVELRDKHRLEIYAQIDEEGWGISEFGYAYFSVRLPTGSLLIAPGLIVDGVSKPRKRFYKYNNALTKGFVEKNMQALLDTVTNQIALNDSNLRFLVHDLRAISSSIYSPALEGANFAIAGNNAEAKIRFDNIIAMQGILRMRIDSLDFLSDTFVYQKSELIPVFKKIEKVVRCFKSSAAEENKRIYIQGNSFGKVKGPDIFELVPYALIDNAVKYAPENSEINVYVYDANTLRCTIKNLGPKIRSAEIANIFNRGTRGLAAISSSLPGTGLGLYMAKRILSDYFHGSIEVDQSPVRASLNGKDYYETSFQVDLPYGI